MTKIFNESVTGEPIYGDLELGSLRANAWVSAGIAADIGTSYNVSSLIDVASGTVGVNFIFPFSSADFVGLCTAQNAAGTHTWVTQDSSNLATGRSDFISWTSASPGDPVRYNIAVIGNNN